MMMRIIDAHLVQEIADREIGGETASLIQYVLSHTPTIEAEPVRHGRWVEIKGMAPPEYHGKHRCSICYARALERKFHEELSEHCPNCGAKMDGDKHDTEE